MTDLAERRVKLTLHYDGGGFFGWQTQPGVRTVQQALESALSRLTDRPTRVMAAGRTDRGVHATGQVASALVPVRWRPATLRRALNSVLPRDLWIAAAEEVPAAFHARFDAVARAYVYRLGLTDAAASPFRRRYCWPVAQDRVPGEPPDPGALQTAAGLVVGERGFGAFAKAGQEERGERCRVHYCAWQPWAAGLELRIVADRFLHHMVRYLVGTMVDVARGRRPLQEMQALLHGATETVTSAPAPPEGLFLARVYYDPEELNREEPIHEDLP